MVRFCLNVAAIFCVSISALCQVPTKANAPQSTITTKSVSLSFPTDGWKPFIFQGKWGYKNAAGDVVLTPDLDFDYCWPFSNGLAKIQVMGYYTFITEHGETVVSDKEDGDPDLDLYDEARDYSEGLAAVMQYETEKWVYIDLTGKIKFYEQYDAAYNFYNGIAIVKVGDLFYYIDKTGKKLFDRGFVDAYPFQEDIAYVKEIGSTGYNYINRTGKMAFVGIYESAYGFNNGQAVVVSPDKQCSVINSKGETLKKLTFNIRATFDNDNRSEQCFVSGYGLAFDTLSKQYFYIDENFEKKSGYYHSASMFDETGRAFVAETRGSYKFINADFAPIFNRTFIGGALWQKNAFWTWVQTTDSLYRGITRDGEFLKSVVTEKVYPTYCGYILTVNHSEYKFINFKGEQALGPYKWAYVFSRPSGLAPVQDEDFNCYFIDRMGAELGKANAWTYVGAFAYGYAPVGSYKTGKYWFVDSEMHNVFNTEYQETSAFNSLGYAKVKLEGKWGLINSNGKIVIPCTYSTKDSCPMKPQ